jgi:hypothetical protein
VRDKFVFTVFIDSMTEHIDYYTSADLMFSGFVPLRKCALLGSSVWIRKG